MPLTLAIIQALLVRVGEELYSIPLDSVIESQRVEMPDVRTVHGNEVITLRGQVVPLVRIAEFFQLGGQRDPDKVMIVIVGLQGRQVGLVVDQFEGEQEIVIKPLSDVVGTHRRNLGRDDSRKRFDFADHRRALARQRGIRRRQGRARRVFRGVRMHYGRSKEEKNSSSLARWSQVVSFRLGSEEYGVDIAQVQEIIRLVEITHVPRAPKFMEGVINLRGQLIPIIDLRTRFGMQRIAATKSTRIIVTEIGKKRVGMVVDCVSEVLNIPVDNVEDAPEMIAGVGTEYIQGVGKMDERLIIMLDLTMVISGEEKQATRTSRSRSNVSDLCLRLARHLQA